jgi:hypothetical protein
VKPNLPPYLRLRGIEPVMVEIPLREGDRTKLALQVWSFYLRHKQYPTTIEVQFFDSVIWDRWNRTDLIPTEVVVYVGEEPVPILVSVVPPSFSHDRHVGATEAWLF